MSVDAVLFDLGGVVCRFRPERRLAGLADACRVPAERVEEVLFSSGFDHLCDLGEASQDDILLRVRDGLGFTGDLRLLQDLWCRAFEPDPEVLALVDRVRPRRTGLFTDNGPLLLDALPRAFPEVAGRFDALAFTCVLGRTKPDPEAFSAALALMGADAGSTLFVDDSARNVEAAGELGIRAVRFTDAAALAGQLDAILGE
ncbi:HAD family phosphatase [Microbispora sp. H11081]|uniref:HAD family hydrolase n=1 Tax=Microbispora sp. H11081 TaxID=2729107 RepID=UPI0014748B01|nr:HAD family phosphatase [Microbispora sp. H11081]